MKTLCVPKLLWCVATLISVSAIVAGLMVTGGPYYQRLLNLDDERINRLDLLGDSIDKFSKEKKRLPNNIREIALFETGRDRRSYFKDPISKKPFEYYPGATQYKLCAVFDTDASEQETADPNLYVPEFTFHSRGRFCQMFDIQKGDES